MMIFVSLPLLSFFIFWIGFSQRICDGRAGFLFAAILWSSVLVGLTELLSLFQGISFLSLLVAWSAVLLVSYLWAKPSLSYWKKTLSIKSALEIPLIEKLIILAVTLVAGIKLFSAITSAPNNYDSLTYHLSRVEHWIQNGTVANYSTHILRQLYSPPFAEYVIMHLRILSSSDHFSNAVQWLASIGSWVNVFMLAQLLGADRRGQWFSVLLAATLPMGLVQSTSTQTDYVLTFWITGYVYLLWESYRDPRWVIVLGAGCCLGLAWLTKGNGYVFSSVFLIAYAIAALIKREQGKLKQLGLIVLCAFIFIVPYACRNTYSFGSPYWTHDRLTNHNISLKGVASSCIANMAVHLQAPYQWEQVNGFVEKSIEGMSKALGLDLNNDLAKIGSESLVFRSQSTGEDDSGNFLFTLLLIVMLGGLFFYPSVHKRTQGLYVATITTAYIIFCTVVQFHFTNSRYHLALFVLWCPVVGTIYTLFLKRLTWILAVLVVIGSLPWLLFSNEHPMIGPKSIFKNPRKEQYYSIQPYLYQPYQVIAQIVESQSCRDVGLMMGENNWEYPWWVLFRSQYGSQFRMEHVEVSNISKSMSYPKGAFNPCALITNNESRIVIVLPEGVYVRVWFLDSPQGLTSVYLKKS